MSVTLVSSAVGTNTVVMPTHQAGDLIYFFAFRDGSNTAPSLPAGYTNLGSSGTNSHSHREFWKIATSSAEAAPTATNATELICLVFRGVNQADPIGANPSGVTGTGTTITYPDMPTGPEDNSGRNAVIYSGGHRSTDVAMETPPDGWTNITSTTNAGKAASHVQYGVRGIQPDRFVNAGGTSSGWRVLVTEILPDLTAVEEQRVTLAALMVGLRAEETDTEQRITSAKVMVGVSVQQSDAQQRVTKAALLVGASVAENAPPAEGGFLTQIALP